MLFKKLACFTLALVMAAQPMVAGATDLDKAFGNLVGNGAAVSINSPGRFQSAARGGFSAGGLEMRVPRSGNVPQLLTASAPRISAGCNGISAHFGGFSFISGAEFANMLKQIASGAALGFVSAIVMKALCPICEAVVQELKTAAQNAAELAKNSCEIGRKFGADFAQGLTGSPDMPSLCASTSADQGDSSDSLKAFSSACKTIRAAREKLKSFNDNFPKGSKEAKRQEAGLNCPTGAGNQTWTSVVALDSEGALDSINSDANTRKLLLINLLGAQMTYAEGVGCDNGDGSRMTLDGEWHTSNYCKPVADMRTYSAMFLCGPKPTSLDGMSSAAKTYCQSLWKGLGPEGAKLWTCKAAIGDNDDDFQNCKYLKLVPADGLIIRGEGFFVTINKLLLSAVERIRSGKGYDDDEGRKIIGLIQAAPYPLYQAINAAAVYPSAATELIDTMSVLVAEQYTHAVFDEILRLEGRSSSSTCLSEPQATRILDFVAQLRTQNQARLQLLAQQFAVQQGITEQIRQINLTIQRQVMSEDLLATGKLSETLNQALSPTNAGSSAPLPATP